MTKTISLLLIAVIIAFTACGPSQEQLASEKAKQDSIAKASQEPLDFKTFLQQFVESVKGNKNTDNYVQKDLGVYVYTNPGVHCNAIKNSKVQAINGLNEIAVTNIFDGKPKGGFCEGYPGEKEGFYYFEITKDELPSYYDAASNADKKVELPANLNYKKFVKVNLIIKEAFRADLYFVCIDSNWYLIAQSFCDCSA
jgi:hypothetical protein